MNRLSGSICYILHMAIGATYKQWVQSAKLLATVLMRWYGQKVYKLIKMHHDHVEKWRSPHNKTFYKYTCNCQFLGPWYFILGRPRHNYFNVPQWIIALCACIFSQSLNVSIKCSTISGSVCKQRLLIVGRAARSSSSLQPPTLVSTSTCTPLGTYCKIWQRRSEFEQNNNAIFKLTLG